MSENLAGSLARGDGGCCFMGGFVAFVYRFRPGVLIFSGAGEGVIAENRYMNDFRRYDNLWRISGREVKVNNYIYHLFF